jgi:hypothetical protein
MPFGHSLLRKDRRPCRKTPVPGPFRLGLTARFACSLAMLGPSPSVTLVHIVDSCTSGRIGDPSRHESVDV